MLKTEKKYKMDFSQIKKGLDEKAFLLVDVRNQDELQAVGKIPGSVNIPRKFFTCTEPRIPCTELEMFVGTWESIKILALLLDVSL